jgi:hypothetical protein
MACNEFNPGCLVGEAAGGLSSAAAGAASGTAQSLVGTVLDGLWPAVSNAVAYVVTTTSTWWVGRPSGLGDGQGQMIDQIRGYVYPLVVMVLVGGLMVQGIRLTIQRPGDPMVRVARGLATFLRQGLTVSQHAAARCCPISLKLLLSQ